MTRDMYIIAYSPSMKKADKNCTTCVQTFADSGCQQVAENFGVGKWPEYVTSFLNELRK